MARLPDVGELFSRYQYKKKKKKSHMSKTSTTEASLRPAILLTLEMISS